MADTSDAAAAEQLPVLVTTGGLFDFTAAGWTDRLEDLKKAAAALKPSTLVMHQSLRAEEAIASMEILDKQTDSLMREIVPPQELIKQKLVKKASELSAAEAVDTCDTLLSFFSMCICGTHTTITLDTCFYVHEPSHAEGHPIGVFTKTILQLMVQVAGIIETSNIRDGDEEFSPVMMCKSQQSYETAVDFEALEAEVKRGGELGKRFELLAALARYTTVGMSLLREGAVNNAEAFGAMAERLLAAVAAAAAFRADASAAVVPPPAAFNPMGSLWETVPIPHQARPPCPWSEAVAVFRGLAEDAKRYLEQWLPSAHDIVTTLENVKDYALEEPQHSLMSRAMAANFIIHGHQLFGGQSVLLTTVALLRDRFGAPWYAALVHPQSDDDLALQKQILDHIGHLESSSSGGSSSQRVSSDEERKRHATLSASSTIMEVSHIFTQIINIYLRNRGRCLRVLVNLLPQLVQIQQQTWQLEHSLSVPAQPQLVKAAQPVLSANAVLMSLVTEVICDVCFHVCFLNQRLGLLTEPEIAPVMLYYHQFLQQRGESLSNLYASTTAIATMKEVGSRRNAPPSLNMRVTKPADSDALGPVEVGAAFTRAMTLVTATLKHKMPQLQAPAEWLQPVAFMFDYRFKPLQAVFHPPLMPYQQIQEYTQGFKESAKIIPQAVEQFKMIAQRVQTHLPNVKRESSRRLLVAVEAAAKKNAVTVGLAHKMEDFILTMVPHAEFPHIVTLNAVKKPVAA